MIGDALQLLVQGLSLSREQAESAMREIIAGQATGGEIAAFITALRVKGETGAELAGCASALRAAATPVHPQRTDLIDTCGTGGDGGRTFNVSTAVAFVLAGMGLAVAKHGNRGVSSRCGSADVLEALGVSVELTPEQVAACIDACGVGFLYAPAFHAGMRHAAPVRRELGFRSVFNLLGPLVNPAHPQRQLIGAFSVDAAETMAHALALLGCDFAWVVHSADGLDELSPCAPATVFQVQGDAVASFELDPREAGIGLASLDGLRGGAAKQNAEIIERVLRGEGGAAAEIVALNAGAGAVIAGISSGMRAGVSLARETLITGKAIAVLDTLRELSARFAQEPLPLEQVR